MLSVIERILFLLAAITSVFLAYTTFRRMTRTINRGQGEIAFEDKFGLIKNGILAVASQGSIFLHRKITSLFHYGVAWGFIFYILVNLIDVAEGYIGDFHFLGDTTLGGIYRLMADFCSIVVLVGVAYFFARRFFSKDPSLNIYDNVTVHPKAEAGIRHDSLLVAAFIFLHIGFRFLGQSFRVAILGGNDEWQPFASLIAGVWQSLSESSLELGWHVSWWLALGLILVFLPYFPYSKHAHLFMGPVNIATRTRRKSLGALTPLDFEDDSIEQFGAAQLLDLSKTQILDAFACIMCNRCQDACPAYVTGKQLSPAAVEVNKRYYLREQMDALASGADESLKLLDYVISESAVWACTTCGACVDVCPVGNEPMFDIVNIRQNLVLMESDFPQELKGAFTGMERQANPWGLTGDRLAWTRDLDFPVPTVEENPEFDILYWVGCAGSFDPNAQEIARATATLLHRAGLNYAVLGNDETCTGDSARRAGNEYLFNELAMTNIEKLKEIGVEKRKIVASCPHCFHTLGKEYSDLGGKFPVVHHTELIAGLLGRGELKLRNDKMMGKVTFHDPCYLGRHNNVYKAPRDSLAQAGATLLEMGRNHRNSFCCGAGGAQMWKEEEHGEQPVSVNRFNEAMRTGAEIVATACPFCAIMMKDASGNKSDILGVKDVAQLVADMVAHPDIELDS